MFDKNKRKVEYWVQKGNYIKVLLKRFAFLIIIFCSLSGILGGLIAYVTYLPEYTVTQSFTIKVINHPGANSATIKNNQLSKTIPSLLSSDTFLNYMKPYMVKTGVKGSFKVTSLENSNIFYLTVVSESNDACMKIINDIQAHYNEVARGVIGDSVMKFMAPAAYKELPSNSPNYINGAVAGLLLSVILVFGLMIVKARFTHTVSTPDDIRDYVNAPCLAVIQRIYHKRRSGESKKEAKKIPLAINESTNLEFKQEISTLTANCEKFCRINEFKSVLVTSTASGEGKSSISLNLACELADRGKRVALLDCDFRVPSLAENLNITDLPIQLTDAILNSSINGCMVKTDFENLYFAGNIKGDTSVIERFTVKGFKTFVDELKKQFDYVIVDSPPAGMFEDALQLAEITDSFIYVIAHNSINRSTVLQSLSSLDESKGTMLGFVINHK